MALPVKLPELELYLRNLYGTPRYFPNCKLSRAFVKIKGKDTLMPADIKTLQDAGFTFRIYNEKGNVVDFPKR
jgi:hypothetical protein